MNPGNTTIRFASRVFSWLMALLIAVPAVLIAVPAVLIAVPANAQVSEMQITRYVPDDTVLGLTVNFESILQHVDRESESVQFLINSAREDGAIDLLSLKRVVMCAGYDYEPGRWDMFGSEESTVNQFEFSEPVDLQKYMDANSWGRTYNEQTVGDFTLHVGEWQEETRDVNAGAMCVTDEGRRLFIGDHKRILKALDAPSDAGVMLVNQMDVEADLAVEFDVSELDQEARDRVYGWLGELQAGMGLDLEDWKESLESGSIVIDFDQDRAGYAVLRFDDEAVAAEAHALLKQGVAALPFLISMMETELENLEREGIEGDGIEARPSFVGRLIPNLKKAVASTRVALDGANVEVTVEAEGGFPELPGLAVLALYADVQAVERQVVEAEAGLIEALEEAEAARDVSDENDKKDDDDG